MGDKPEDSRSTIPPDAPDEDRASRGAKKLVERLLKKGIVSGMEAISKSEDTVRGVIEGMRIPKEMVTLALEQIDETKNGLYRVVAKEIRDFLESTNFATEMKKILTGLAFEVKMEIRFKSTDEDNPRASIRPDVSADVSVKEKEKERDRKRRRSE